MDAKELESRINKKFGKYKNHKIDENVDLIRTLETNEIVILDSKSSANGHHLLKDANQEEIEKISAYFKFSENDENDTSHIPDNDPPSGWNELTPEQKKEADFIPGLDDESDEEDDGDGTSHIPD